MAEEPENVMLRLMREMRAKLDDVSMKLEEHDHRFDKVDQRLDEIHETMYTTAGMAMHANVRHEAVSKQLDDLRKRVERLEEKV